MPGPTPSTLNCFSEGEHKAHRIPAPHCGMQANCPANSALFAVYFPRRAIERMTRPWLGPAIQVIRDSGAGRGPTPSEMLVACRGAYAWKSINVTQPSERLACNTPGTKKRKDF
jgi:hypothetical protein